MKKNLLLLFLTLTLLLCPAAFSEEPAAEEAPELTAETTLSADEIPAGEAPELAAETTLSADEIPAVEAPELTASCTFASNAKTQDFSLLMDHNVSTYYPLNDKKGWLTITSETPVYGLSVSMLNKYGYPISYDLQYQDADGKWQTFAQSGPYLVAWHVLETPLTTFRLKATSTERVRIAELRVFGQGTRPADVQDWQTLEKCDLMLLTCHPDDEVLWFGGLLPDYGCERGYRLQHVIMTPGYGERQLELLGCLWHCGIRYYPHFIGLRDKHGGSIEKQYTQWKGKNHVMSLVTEVIRKYKPEVLITQGIEGEYGHSAHRVTSEAARLCVGYAAKKNQFTASVKKYGTWQVKKLYLHEYEENPIVMDWNQPLSAFGGKTGFDIAEEAFQFHASQVEIGHYEFQRGSEGDHDNTRFGLYYTAVGPDTGIGDFMEHIVIEQ